jgi:hypothetical protein
VWMEYINFLKSMPVCCAPYFLFCSPF